MNHKTIISIFGLGAILVYILLYANAKADAFSGKSTNTEQRHLTVCENEFLLVVVRTFPGFEKTSLYKVDSEKPQRIATISGGYGSIVACSKTSCLVEAAIDWQSKKLMDINQTFIHYSFTDKIGNKLISFSRSNTYTNNLIRDKYCIFQNNLYFFKSGDLLCLGDLDFLGPPKRQIIHTTVKTCQQFDTALLISDGNEWFVYDGADEICLPGYDMGYDYKLNLIKIENVIFISDNTKICCYYIQDNLEVNAEWICPCESAKLQSSLFYKDGILYSIWEGYLYAYDIYKKQWTSLFQLNQNYTKRHTLEGSEIAICNNYLYLVLQTIESSTKADLYCYDLRNLGKQKTEQEFIKLMRVSKTGFFE